MIEQKLFKSIDLVGVGSQSLGSFLSQYFEFFALKVPTYPHCDGIRGFPISFKSSPISIGCFWVKWRQL
jgi:hypothetical protein